MVVVYDTRVAVVYGEDGELRISVNPVNDSFERV